jgi:hypothetical protein
LVKSAISIDRAGDWNPCLNWVDRYETGSARNFRFTPHS